MSDLRPVFLLSLPRSGSTLLQRMIAAHPCVATVSEPWLLLPFLYTMRPSGVFAEYQHWAVVRAIEDLRGEMRDGPGAYEQALREFGLRIYAQLAHPGAIYFLDKTPRYHLIAEDVARVFPDARFILLWRNPLDIAASIMRTWADGRWNLDRWTIDLYDGVENLDRFQQRMGGRIHVVRYEELVGDAERVLKDIFATLDLPRVESAAVRTVQLNGRMGDPGFDPEAEVSSCRTKGWAAVFSNPLRRSWARGYIDWLGAERLERLGYSAADLLEELRAERIGARHVLSDSVRRLRAFGRLFFDQKIYREKRACSAAGRHPHIYE